MLAALPNGELFIITASAFTLPMSLLAFALALVRLLLLG